MKNLSRILILLLTLAGGLSCVDKVDLSLPAQDLPVIVDGMITTEPGPDTVKITQSYPADGGFHGTVGVPGAIVTVADDTGFRDTLINIGFGKYVTNLLNGVVGRTYQLSILFPDTINGTPAYTMAVSTPQRLVEAGAIDSIYYELNSRTNSNGIIENGFNVFLNTSLAPGSSGRLLWEFFGTYTVTTDPSPIRVPPPECGDPPCPPVPLECAAGCICCTCWYTTHEQSPIVSNPAVFGGSQLNRVWVQYIPINSQTFYDRYRVEISQMELSEEVFDFYKAIRKQSDNANSIFQPPFFKLKGNITVQSGSRGILGTFAASTIVKRHIFILRSDVPYNLSAELLIADCRAIAQNSTLTEPPYWP